MPSRVTAVVAAFNEEGRIGGVLDVLTTYPGFAEVIVVDDGSTDHTGDQARRYPVTYLRLDPNQGKGRAMDVGVAHAGTEVVFFADADIRGLTHTMITETCRPVLAGECDVAVLARNRWTASFRWILFFLPLVGGMLGGERAVTVSLWEAVPDRFKDGFRIETALNYHAARLGEGLRRVDLFGIDQVPKERKFGRRRGLARRLAMNREILRTAWELRRLRPDTSRRSVVRRAG